MCKILVYAMQFSFYFLLFFSSVAHETDSGSCWNLRDDRAFISFQRTMKVSIITGLGSLFLQVYSDQTTCLRFMGGVGAVERNCLQLRGGSTAALRLSQCERETMPCSI